MSNPMAEIQEAWDSYNADRMDGDDFACLVATILQLTTDGASTFASEKTAKDAHGLPSGLMPPPINAAPQVVPSTHSQSDPTGTSAEPAVAAPCIECELIGVSACSEHGTHD